MHSNMTREELKKVFELAKKSKSDVYVAITMPGQEDYEYIINKNKSMIYSIEDGFDYLGYKFKVINGKTIVRESPKTISNVVKRVKHNVKNYNNGENL